MKRIIVLLIIVLLAFSAFRLYQTEKRIAAQKAAEAAAALRMKPDVQVRIIEGRNLKQIEASWRENKELGLIFSKSLANETAGDWSSRFSFLKSVPAKSSLEGYLFPDTYRIYASSTAEEMIAKMLSNFEDKVTPDILSDIKAQGRSLSEVITLASLIEKEVRSSSDMEIVSGIFKNRIESGQPLQSCATLAYILGENKPQYSEADTKVESPYNTYRHKGLPPAPIANPGLRAIKAALHPTDTKYNYFLTRPDTGETVFSRTYDEHLANKAKYLK